MNWRRRRNNSPPGAGGVARSARVVDGSNNSPPHLFIGIKKNHFNFSTTPALRATPPVPGGELLFALLQFIHTFTDRAYSSPGSVTLPPPLFLRKETDQLLLSAMRYLKIAT